MLQVIVLSCKEKASSYDFVKSYGFFLEEWEHVGSELWVWPKVMLQVMVLGCKEIAWSYDFVQSYGFFQELRKFLVDKIVKEIMKISRT